jgi:selenide,water dikinase
MLAASGAAATVTAAAVPLLPAAADLAAAGFVSGGTRANTARIGPFTNVDPAVPEDLVILLYDAQTSGGLLLATPAAAAGTLLADLQARGLPAALIGEVVSGEPVAPVPRRARPACARAQVRPAWTRHRIASRPQAHLEKSQ